MCYPVSTQTIDSKAKEPHTKPRMLKPERVPVATDHEESCDLDFCVQKANGTTAVGIYIRHSEQDIFDHLVGLQKYECKQFRGVRFETLKKETIKAMMDMSPAPSICKDKNVFMTQKALDEKGVFYYLFWQHEEQRIYDIFKNLQTKL
jgi:hypothetical protein